MIQYKIFFILILSISYYTPIFSQIYVEGSGSIQEAIDSANPGDTIFVKKGIYYESNIIVNKAVAIIGDEYPVVDAQEKGFIFEITSDSVTISGLKIINVAKSYTKDFSAIHAYNVKHFAIINNIFENPFFAIHIERSKWGVIANNTIIGNAVEEASSGNGIHMWHTSRIEVNDNRIEHMRDGIYFEFVKHSSVKGNKSKHNIRYGLHFMFSNDDVYEGNQFEKNGAGVAVMFSKKIIMRKNIFKLNWGTASYGLLLKEIYDADIIENTFEQNTIGVNAEGSNRIMYERNNFNNNGWAIKFLGGCYGNKLHQNNFMNNAFDISYNGRINGNVFDKNYWSEYAGYDLDRDGVGDVPYRPVKLFSYIVNRTPETIVLLRSLFVDIINYSEKVSPIFTPDNLKDFHPLMKPVK